MQMSYLYASDLPFKNFIISGIWPVSGPVIVKKNQLTLFCHASVLILLKINFVITLSKFEIKFETRTCTRCFMQMSYLYAPGMSFKSFIYLRHLTSFGSPNWRQLFMRLSTYDAKLCHNIVKVAVETRAAGCSKLWQCYDASYHQ